MDPLPILASMDRCEGLDKVRWSLRRGASTLKWLKTSVNSLTATPHGTIGPGAQGPLGNTSSKCFRRFLQVCKRGLRVFEGFSRFSKVSECF